MLVAVYGTLKRGCGNNDVMKMANGKYIRSYWTDGEFTMYSLGGFPAITLGGKQSIHVELWDVETIAPLDTLEGWYGPNDPTNMYQRTLIHTPIGPALIYYMLEEKVKGWYDVVESGNWSRYVNNLSHEDRCIQY